MGLWAGIKYALNSTLGTADFKPLDKLLNDLIVEQTRMVASDDLYCSLENATVTGAMGVTTTLVHPQKLKMTRNGTVRFKGTLTRQNTNSTRGYFRIYKNGEQVYEWYRDWETGDYAETFSVDVSFAQNDVLSFELIVYAATSGATRYLMVTDFAMYGTIENNVFLEC